MRDPATKKIARNLTAIISESVGFELCSSDELTGGEPVHTDEDGESVTVYVKVYTFKADLDELS